MASQHGHQGEGHAPLLPKRLIICGAAAVRHAAPAAVENCVGGAWNARSAVKAMESDISDRERLFWDTTGAAPEGFAKETSGREGKRARA